MKTDVYYGSFEYSTLLRNERHWSYKTATKFWNTKSRVTHHENLPIKTLTIKLNEETYLSGKMASVIGNIIVFYSLPSSLNSRFKRKKLNPAIH